MAGAPVNQGSYRISGRYGEAWRNGLQLFECTGVTATVQIGQTDVPLAGLNRNGTKDGIETRTGGQLMLQKIDDRWGNDLYGFLGYSLEERRKLRDAGTPPMRTFSLQIWLDDPEALGSECWELQNVRLFNLPLGFSTSNEIESRTFDFRWEAEYPLQNYEIQGNQVDPTTGLPVISYTHSLTA
jgi:hypothetical protein